MSKPESFLVACDIGTSKICVLIGEPNAGLIVSGARRVGPDRWYVPPGAIFSVEGPQGKAGAGGYRITEATFGK